MKNQFFYKFGTVVQVVSTKMSGLINLILYKTNPMCAFLCEPNLLYENFTGLVTVTSDRGGSGQVSHLPLGLPSAKTPVKTDVTDGEISVGVCRQRIRDSTQYILFTQKESISGLTNE